MENSTIQFTKMHGAGNDYIYVNTLLYNIKDPAKASIEWSKPHFGIGSDGLILIGEATGPDADFSMRIFNNDGSEAMMCGNGTRCVAKFLHDKGLTDKNPIRLQTLSGIKVDSQAAGTVRGSWRKGNQLGTDSRWSSVHRNIRFNGKSSLRYLP